MKELTKEERAAQVEAVTIETKMLDIVGNWEAQAKLTALRDDAHYARVRESAEAATAANKAIEARNRETIDLDQREAARREEWHAISLKWHEASLASHTKESERFELMRREVEALERIAGALSLLTKQEF